MSLPESKVKANKRWIQSWRKRKKYAPPIMPYERYIEFSYPQTYTTLFRNTIRERDNHTCQICGAKGINTTLHIHHIDYDKRNCDETNLITLCPACHTKTNHNRLYWHGFFCKLKMPLLEIYPGEARHLSCTAQRSKMRIVITSRASGFPSF